MTRHATVRRSSSGHLKWFIAGIVALTLVVGVVIVLVGYQRSEPGESASVTQAAARGQQSAPGSAATLFVSPDGSKGPCTVTSPCTLSQALESAPRSAVVELMAGDYGKLKVRPTASTRAGTDVVITAAEGAEVKLAGLDLYASNLTWRGLTVSGVVYLRGSATNTVIDQFTVNSGGAFVRADDVVIKNSTFEYGSSLDGIQIGGAHRVRIESNVIRDYDQNGTSGYHSDCIQLFDSSEVIVSRNRLSNCSNAGIIFSGGAGLGISSVTVESNFIQSCVTKSDACRGGSAIDVREPSTRQTIVRNNTILNGSARVGTQPDLIFDRNIVGYLSDCEGMVTNSIIHQYNEGNCKDPGKLESFGNRIGEVPVVDVSTGELYPVSASSVQIEPAGQLEPAPLTVDGAPMAANIAGAAG